MQKHRAHLLLNVSEKNPRFKFHKQQTVSRLALSSTNVRSGVHNSCSGTEGLITGSEGNKETQEGWK